MISEYSNDWKFLTLEDCLAKVIDYRGKSVPKSETGVRLITARNVRMGYIDTSSEEYIPAEVYDDWMDRGLPKYGDVLFTTEAPVGNVALYPKRGKYALGQRLITLRADEENLHGGFLLYYFLSARGQDRILARSTGSTVIGISQKSLRKLKVPLPPLAEQKRIAEILGTWDTAIAQVEALVAALTERKKGLMQRLLTGEVRFPGFTEAWEEVKVDDLGEIITGGTPSTTNPDYWEGDIAWVTPTDITALESKYVDDSKRKITQSGLKSSAAKIIQPNSIIVCTRATIGDSAINLIPMATNQGFKSLTLKDKYHTEFVYYLISKSQHLLERFASGSTFMELSKSDFGSIKFLIPQYDEQKDVAKILDICDQSIEYYRIQNDHLREQKKGLMQRLLTGEVRVKV